MTDARADFEAATGKPKRLSAGDRFRADLIGVMERKAIRLLGLGRRRKLRGRALEDFIVDGLRRFLV
jgi:hypothetical protein